MGTTRRLDTGRLLLGFALLALGLLFIAGQAGWADVGRLFERGWPLILVAAGLLQLAVNPRAWLGPVLVIGLGGVLLLFSFDIVPGSAASMLWPLVLIAIGLFVILGHGAGRPGATVSAENRVSAIAIFGGSDVANRSQEFQSGTLIGIFGAVTADLRQAALDLDGATIDAYALFGGVDILVPRGWHVSISGLPIFGGYSDETQGAAAYTPGDPVLQVRAVTLFGGVTVKNNT